MIVNKLEVGGGEVIVCRRNHYSLVQSDILARNHREHVDRHCANKERAQNLGDVLPHPLPGGARCMLRLEHEYRRVCLILTQ